MVRTQIQISEELYREIRQFAAGREWSLAETFRRGIEELLDVYPWDPIPKGGWVLPEPLALGCRELTNEQLKELAQENSAPGDGD